jgi:hypothetical protein
MVTRESSPKLDALLDIGTSMLIRIRDQLFLYANNDHLSLPLLTLH